MSLIITKNFKRANPSGAMMVSSMASRIKGKDHYLGDYGIT